MKKTSIALFCGMLVLGALQGIAGAAVYQISPVPGDMYDLSHYDNYVWGVDWAAPANERITGAVLTFRNIYDWTKETDHLYTHLLASAEAGTQVSGDDAAGGDNFAGQGALVGDWNDPAGGKARGFDLVYDFGALGLLDTFESYAEDGNFGFGFDPDCHYFNDGIVLSIVTETVGDEVSPVPEPASILLLGTGLFGVLGAKMRRLI